MIYDLESKPWIPLIEFIAKQDENEKIKVRVLVEGMLEDGTGVFVTLPEDLMMSFLESLADRLRLPDV